MVSAEWRRGEGGRFMVCAGRTAVEGLSAFRYI